MIVLVRHRASFVRRDSDEFVRLALEEQEEPRILLLAVRRKRPFGQRPSHVRLDLDLPGYFTIRTRE